VMLSLSSIIIPEFCRVFPPVQSNLATALSVEDNGHTTSQDHAQDAAHLTISILYVL